MVADLNAAQAVNMLDVHQERRVGGPKIHRGEQRLSAGEHDSISVASQDADRFFKRARRLVAKNGGLHRMSLGRKSRFRMATYKSLVNEAKGATAAQASGKTCKDFARRFSKNVTLTHGFTRC